MKVIANHAVDPHIKLEPNTGSDRSWVWSAFDFSDGELEETVFALRFADSEIANDFKTKFLECQKEMEAILAGEDKPGEDGGAGADEAAEALSGLKTNELAASKEMVSSADTNAKALSEEKALLRLQNTSSDALMPFSVGRRNCVGQSLAREEDEEVVFSMRAKLFLFGETLLDKGTGNKWNFPNRRYF